MKPTKKQLEMWDRLREHGCAICRNPYVHIHHCGTGAGGRKNHDFVLPLCEAHHTGKEGIHSLGRKKWQALYGTEQELLDKLLDRL